MKSKRTWRVSGNLRELGRLFPCEHSPQPSPQPAPSRRERNQLVFYWLCRPARHYCTLFVALLLLCSGCAMVGLRQDLAALDTAAEISGSVVVDTESRSPVFVALYKETADKPTLQTYWIAYDTSEFRLFAPAGKYYLFAFEDTNENATFDPDEQVGWYGKPTLLVADAGSALRGLHLTLRTPAEARLALPQLYIPTIERMPLERVIRNPGTVVPLTDRRFRKEHARKGLWEPVKFLDDPGGGLFFLEPYDAARIPVLFIHGAGGFPQQWSAVIDSLDRTRFQPWIFHYPSGLRLGFLGETLAMYLRELHLKHGFEQICVVAHSMGGLVARSAVNDCIAHDSPFTIRLLLTLATPWQGHRAATQGVEHSPVVIPSWYDMAPGSPFLRSLSATPLPPTLDFALFFGYRGSAHWDGELSDGTVMLSSVLDRTMQEVASTLRGFDANHVSILQNQNAITTLHRVLGENTAIGGPVDDNER